ncbi:MAG: helix-turn-helix transcriptional regulator [Bacteroidaceae bacterium]|nr:helix-turn-helix transcriptional regulator [Bacteroidaceae bacterium]
MRFKEVLEKYGITQTELAERLGINRVSVSRLFSEKNDMRSSTIMKIAEAIGCSAGELYDDFNKVDDSNTITCPTCGTKIEFKKKEEE